MNKEILAKFFIIVFFGVLFFSCSGLFHLLNETSEPIEFQRIVNKETNEITLVSGDRVYEPYSTYRGPLGDYEGYYKYVSEDYGVYLDISVYGLYNYPSSEWVVTREQGINYGIVWREVNALTEPDDLVYEFGLDE